MSGLTDDEYAALADFRFALRRFQAFSESRAAECGLTPQQHQTLLTIRGAGDEPATVGYVADRLILKPHSATGLVDRRHALDLVARQASPTDRRQTLLSLTAKAEALLEQLSAGHREELRRLRPMLTEMLERLG